MGILTETRNAILANYLPPLEYIVSRLVFLKLRIEGKINLIFGTNQINLNSYIEQNPTCRIHTTRYIDSIAPNIIPGRKLKEIKSTEKLSITFNGLTEAFELL